MPALITRHLKSIGTGTLLGPAAVLLISANIANAANLAFNMIFARLVGPALFADLTLLLTLKLGILSFLGAIQFAFAERVAKTGHQETGKIQAQSLSWHSLKFSVPVMFVIMALANYLSALLNFSSPLSLALLALAIPFFLPMVIYRGLTQGMIDIKKIILSIQSEWIIRLIGSLLLWKMGFGLPGIAIAVGLSILAGFLFSTDRQDRRLYKQVQKAQNTVNVKALSITALPYLILQAAQIIVLDSDILIAKGVFSAEAAGLVAGLLLIQRIFFFAFLSCSTLLQPYIAQQKDGSKTPKELYTLILAIGCLTAIALSIIVPKSELFVTLMLGNAYSDLSPIIWISALIGTVFILSHLCAVYQIAKGKTYIAYIVLGFGCLQLFTLTAVNHFFSDIGLHTYFSLKLAIQIICALCLLGNVMFEQRPRKLNR